MALAKRIIPCLDVDNGRVVKGVKFENIRDAGDPVEIARRYDEQGADEITFLDISASGDGRDTTLHTVERMASQVFIPLTVGGGVNWQNKVWTDVEGGPAGRSRAEQGSYGLVNLFSRYQVTKDFAVQANVNNLFDKEYYDYVGSYVVYGAPLNVSVSASYDF